MIDPRYHNYELKSLIVKEKDGSSWAMVCYDSTKDKRMEKELREMLRKVQSK